MKNIGTRNVKFVENSKLSNKNNIDRSPDSPMSKKEKLIAQQEKKAAKMLQRLKQKEDDPFEYYFGVTDPDKERKTIMEFTSKAEMLKKQPLDQRRFDSSNSENSNYKNEHFECESSSSQEDDKTQPGFLMNSSQFNQLPANVKTAVKHRQMKQKHSSFYYKMKDLNHKIQVYKQIFDNRVPSF